MPVSVISKAFTIWINFLYHELPLRFVFPSQKLVSKHLPKTFEKHPTTQIIIDGTKNFVERATSVKTQTKAWSNHKHHNTWKALVSISPNGTVTFVHLRWRGGVSDKELTKCSGLLKKIELGDRGFNIADILSSGATFNIPAFKEGRDQLNPE